MHEDTKKLGTELVVIWHKANTSSGGLKDDHMLIIRKMSIAKEAFSDILKNAELAKKYADMSGLWTCCSFY